MARTNKLLVGIDVGTSACKATVLTTRGRVVAEAAHGYPTRRTSSGEVSQDPADWLRAVRSSMRQVVAHVDGRIVEALCVTAPAHYAVLLDRANRPMTRVLLSSDGRPASTARRLRERIGGRFFDTTGVSLTAGWTLPQLRWLLDEDPSLAPRLGIVLIAKDWIRYELTGVAATDPSDAAGTGMYDLHRGDWAPEIIDEAGIRRERLPPIRAATSVGGSLSGRWARRLGLRSGIPVVVGATDTAAELVSVGALDTGDAIVKVASTGTVVAVTDVPRPDLRLLTYPHILPGRFYGMGATSTAATSDVWLRATILGANGTGASATGGLDREVARREAARIPIGSEGLLFLPHLEGERSPYWDPELRGAFVGLTSSHGRAHLCRAVLEGVALSLRDCRDALADAGLDVGDPVLAGGGLRSPLWQRIVVDCLGVPARYVPTQGPSVGAAMMAGTAIGSDVMTAHAATRRWRGRRIEPRPENRRRYDDMYDIYLDAVSALTEVSHRLARSRSGASPST